MIQELLSGAGLLGGGDRKFSFHGTILEGVPSSSSSPSPSPSPSPSASTTTTTNTHSTLTTTPPPLENLRCPRCDSPNTKFCYYNNYNLTQPRHFCKTCRRYWTKGGALRNVPIGGGCRKNKSTIVSAATGKSTAGKGKIVSSDYIKSNVVSGLDHEQSNNPVLWGSPQNSQLLSLLRGNQNPNPISGSLPNFVHFKEEGHMIGSHVPSESSAVIGTVNARTVGLDPFGQVPIGLYTSLFRNQPQQHQNQNQNQNQNLSTHGDRQNAGLQELYQRLRSSINYQPDHSFATLTNVTTSSISMMETAPATSAAEFGSWNPPFPWSDLSTTTNGAFP